MMRYLMRYDIVFCQRHQLGKTVFFVRGTRSAGAPKSRGAGEAGVALSGLGLPHVEVAASPAYPVEAYPAGRPQCGGCTAK